MLADRPANPTEALIFAEILVIVALVILNGVLAGAEMAIVTLRKSRVEQLLQQGSRRARLVKSLQDDPERFLATVQVGITVISSAAGAFGGATFARDFAPVLAPLPLVGAYAEPVALVLVVTMVSFLSVVLGELVPKSLALRHSEGYALFIAGPLSLLASIARPFVWVLTASSNLVLRVFGDRTSFTEGRVSAEELQQIVGDAAKDGSVDPAIGEIASRAIDFGGLTAYHVMVPRHRVVSISRKAKPDEIRRILVEQGHTRMPVHEERPDQIIGYVTVRDILMRLWDNASPPLVDDAIRPAFFAPSMQRAVDLLGDMRRRGVQLAVIVDEMGAMVGIVTLEDLVEELVGEIIDEHRSDRQIALTPDPDGTLVAPATVPVREVNRRLSLDLPDGPGWSTLAGLCIHLAGRIPSQGERLRHSDGTSIDVLESTPRRVLSVRIHPPPRPDLRDDDRPPEAAAVN